VYNLKIIGLATQRDTQSLIRILLRVPGLSPELVSKGLRVPPFDVLSAEKEEEVEKIKSMLEKLGAVCEIEKDKKNTSEEVYSKKHILGEAETRKILLGHKVRIRWGFWSIIFTIFAVLVFSTFYFSKDKGNKPKTSKSKITQVSKANTPAPAPVPQKPVVKTTAKINNELKKDLIKNPYNTNAWKTLFENFEKEGDTTSARIAKESYEKAVRAQMVLASLAKTFGNNVRVEITEDAVLYRTSKDLTDGQFHLEALRLRDSLNTKYPGKTLIIENYTTDNRLQSIKLRNAD